MEFHATGTLENVLERFKTEFLKTLTRDDLKRTVRLTVSDGSSTEETVESLKVKILEVLSDA